MTSGAAAVVNHQSAGICCHVCGCQYNSYHTYLKHLVLNCDQDARLSAKTRLERESMVNDLRHVRSARQ